MQLSIQQRYVAPKVLKQLARLFKRSGREFPSQHQMTFSQHETSQKCVLSSAKLCEMFSVKLDYLPLPDSQ